MSAVGAVGQERRKFLHRFCGLCIVFAPMIFLQAKSRAQQDSRPLNNGEHKPEDESAPIAPGSRKAALEENEKNIKKKVEKLFQLATELKDEVDKTDSAKVLSVPMLKKAEEIEKLAKDIKSRARG
jgi:membrane-associated HD superfamily phosphohydrolase